MFKKKNTSRRKHSVKGHLQLHQLSKAGTSVEFEIFADGEKIGNITIGRGSLIWQGARKQSSKKIDWSRFAELMNDFCYGKSK